MHPMWEDNVAWESFWVGLDHSFICSSRFTHAFDQGNLDVVKIFVYGVAFEGESFGRTVKGGYWLHGVKCCVI